MAAKKQLHGRASNCLAPPSKKSVQAATVEFSVASSRGIERPLRSCRVISALQPAHLAPLPLPVLQTRPIKAEKLSSKAECTLSLTNVATPCASTPKPTGKCHAAVDEHCPVSLCTHVFQNDQGVNYDVMLNQTDIANNNNKHVLRAMAVHTLKLTTCRYYLIQLLQDDANSELFHLFKRWGRVGYSGGASRQSLEQYDSQAQAIEAFCLSFDAKTHNDWEEICSGVPFVSIRGKYTMLERDYSDSAHPQAPSGAEAKARVCTLPLQLQLLLNTICSIAMMKAAMSEIGYDSVKCPLGKLSHSVIMQGMAVLRQIEAKISSQAGTSSLAELSSLFYTFIPHVSGMSAPPTIRDLEAVAGKVELLMCLLDVTVAVRKMEASEQAVTHPLDHVYISLHCGIQPLEPGPLLDMLRKYMMTTHGQTHQEWKLELQAVYVVSRSEEESRFEPHKLDQNRRLLWHGSRTSNFMGILSQGLRIAPPESPSTGYMFDKGVYFAEVASKSAQYCFPSKKNPTGILLLSEVALGQQLKLSKANYSAKKACQRAGLDSVKGVGRNGPSEATAVHLPGGARLCMGPMASDDDFTSGDLLYSEHVIYDIARCRMRFLLLVNFVYNE